MIELRVHRADTSLGDLRYNKNGGMQLIGEGRLFRMKVRLTTLICAAMTVSIAPGAFAQPRWGGTGHEHITTGAISHLPQPLKGFFQANSATVVNASGDEPPSTHYIDIDVYPEFFAGTFPHQWSAAVAMYGVSTLNSNGIGPWNAETYAANLSTQMANAHTQQAWLDLLSTAGALAHYVEDMHNPLHLTENYNGQLTGNTGIHSRYESQMITRHLTSDLPIVAMPSHCVHYPAIIDAIFDEIDVNYYYVDDIMAADTAAKLLDSKYGTTYYNKLWTDTGAFTQVLFQDASEMVASAWYTAWVNAGSPMPIPAPVMPGDMNCDGVVNIADVSPFVLALTDPAGYASTYPSCDISLADMNADTMRDGRDIQSFVTASLAQ
jgi:hypothetical protein